MESKESDSYHFQDIPLERLPKVCTLQQIETASMEGKPLKRFQGRPLRDIRRGSGFVLETKRLEDETSVVDRTSSIRDIYMQNGKVHILTVSGSIYRLEEDLLPEKSALEHMKPTKLKETVQTLLRKLFGA